MRRMLRHILILTLALSLFFGLSIAANAAWTDDTLPAEEMKALMNSQTLYPQRTGYMELDSLIEKALEPYKDSDTYTKLHGLYDWTVRNITYSWDGYSQQWAPCYDKFTLNYLPDLTYEKGLQEAIPQEIVNRSYHAMTKNKGICYDWGALMAIMARYVGLEAYVHTGYFVFEETGLAGHHGWCEIILDGKNYIFDPQRDYRWTLNGTDKDRALYYFGIPADGKSNHRYTILPDTVANAARDAQFLPVTASRSVEINTVASRSGTVSNSGACVVGKAVTLTASGSLEGWYDSSGNLLSTENPYTFTANTPITLYAIFTGDHFVDIPKSTWYEAQVSAAVERGITKGTDALHFDPDGTFTRAMVVEMLSRIDGADTASAPACSYSDVNQSQWYAKAVNWATEHGIVKGIGEGKFAPEQVITRQEFVTILGRYLEEYKGLTLGSAETTFQDTSEIADFAREWVGKAVEIGLIEGYPDNRFGPTDASTRAVGATIMVRLDNYLNAA